MSTWKGKFMGAPTLNEELQAYKEYGNMEKWISPRKIISQFVI